MYLFESAAKIFMSSDVPPAEMMAANEQIISITTLTIGSDAEIIEAQQQQSGVMVHIYIYIYIFYIAH